MNERTLVSLRTISALEPIDGADFIEAQSNPKIGLGILLSCGIIDASGNMTEEFGGTLPAKPKEN